MSHKAYDVSLNAGRSLLGTQKRLDAFKRFITRLDGDIADTYMYRQSNTYIGVMVRVVIAEEHVETVRAHQSVYDVSGPPKVAW